MNGKIVGLAILLSALIAGGTLYYLQVYGFYEEVTAEVDEMRLRPLGGETPQPILAENITAIDAESSPIRFRACFTTTSSLAMLTETYQGFDRAIPRNAPDWFDCFDADAIGAALQAEQAIAYMGEAEIMDGLFRVNVNDQRPVSDN